jgi:hypothetical protein
MSKHQSPPDALARPVIANRIPGDASAAVSIDDAFPADPKFDSYAFVLALLDED